MLCSVQAKFDLEWIYLIHQSVGNGSKLVAGRLWHYATYISRPTMTLYRPVGRSNHAAILVSRCIARYDPQALLHFQASGSYRTSGWFLPEQRLAAVTRCMQKTGWLLMPVRIYTL